MLSRTLVISATIACIMPAAAGMADRQGNPRAIDGDTLDMGHRVRLFGIDAPEYRQNCPDQEHGRPVGIEAKLALQALMDRGTVTCRGMGTDRWNRTLAVCYVGNTEINREMVRLGWAFNYARYTHDYLGEEFHARNAGGAVWTARCESPETWRHNHK